MDLSKAFDTIYYDLLIAKLHAYSFNMSSLKVLLIYLNKTWHRSKIKQNFNAW